jgi:HTH-type transcriptional regulator/antitoxin HigA
MEIKPIRNEEDYDATLKEIESLWESQVGTPDGDRLEVLVTLVEAYETEHYPVPVIDDPVGVLEYYMESKGLSRSDLIPYIGHKGRVSNIFNHKRSLSIEMIRRLHEGLNIPADLLIGKSSTIPANQTPKPHIAKMKVVGRIGKEENIPHSKGAV